jgi:putative oxidoreductase
MTMNQATTMNPPASTDIATPPRIAGLLRTSAGLSSTVLRLTLAVVLFPHGAQKLLGWFGGYGFDGTRSFLTTQVGLPDFLAVGIILLEFFGPILLLLGLLTRPVALATVALMIGAIVTVHWPNGFFMNWTGAQAGEGFEYHLLAMAIGVALVIQGGGLLSLDARLSGRSARENRV